LTQYIALLECQEIRYPNPFRKEKHRIGLHVEIQSLDDIDADGNLKHDIVISKLQTSRPFLVPEEVFDRLQQTPYRRVAIPRLNERQLEPRDLIYTSNDGFQILLESERGNWW